MKPVTHRPLPKSWTQKRTHRLESHPQRPSQPICDPAELFRLHFKTRSTRGQVRCHSPRTLISWAALFALRPVHLLVRFFHTRAVRSLPAVVGLDGEGVVFLKLTVQFLFGADYPLTRGLIHYHSIKRDILPVDFKATNLTWGVKQNRLVCLPLNLPHNALHPQRK